MARILGNDLLRGDLVRLDHLRRDDIPAVARMWSDLEFARHLMRRPAYPLTEDEVEEWYKETLKEDAEPSFAIRALDDDRFIGAIGFKDLRWPSRHSFFWVGIGAPELRGKGYGADAVRVLLKYAFLELNLNCLALEVMAYNDRAIAAYRKIGFTHDGTARAYVYRDGVYYDVWYMSMLRQEWEVRYGEEARRGYAE